MRLVKSQIAWELLKHEIVLKEDPSVLQLLIDSNRFSFVEFCRSIEALPLVQYYVSNGIISVNSNDKDVISEYSDYNSIIYQMKSDYDSNIIDRLRSSDIELIEFKGNKFTNRIYPQPGLRKHKDLDLLMRNPKEEELIISFFESQNFKLTTRNSTNNYSVGTFQKWNLLDLDNWNENKLKEIIKNFSPYFLRVQSNKIYFLSIIDLHRGLFKYLDQTMPQIDENNLFYDKNSLNSSFTNDFMLAYLAIKLDIEAQLVLQNKHPALGIWKCVKDIVQLVQHMNSEEINEAMVCAVRLKGELAFFNSIYSIRDFLYNTRFSNIDKYISNNHMNLNLLLQEI